MGRGGETGSMYVPELIAIAIKEVCSRGMCTYQQRLFRGWYLHIPMDLQRLHIVRAHTYGCDGQNTEYVHVPPTLNQRPHTMFYPHSPPLSCQFVLSLHSFFLSVLFYHLLQFISSLLEAMFVFITCNYNFLKIDSILFDSFLLSFFLVKISFRVSVSFFM